MKKYIQLHVTAGVQKLTNQLPLEEFEEKTGISIDQNDIGNVDQLTKEEIGDYAISYFNKCRYSMRIDNEETIRFTGFEILEDVD